MKLNSILSLAAVAFVAATASAQDLSQKVSYSTTGRTLPAIAADLQKLTGVTITVQLDSRKDVIALRAKDVPLLDLLKKIAETSGNGLFSQGQGVLIQRDGQMDRNLKAAEDAMILARLKVAMEKTSKNLLNPTQTRGQTQVVTAGGNAQMAEQAATFFNVPNKAIGEMIPTLPADSLAKMEVGQRLVFSSNRTNMQLPLSNPALAAAERAFKAQVSALGQGGQGGMMGGAPPELAEQLANSRPHRAYLVVTRQSETVFALELRVTALIDLSAFGGAPGGQGGNRPRGGGGANLSPTPIVFGFSAISLDPEPAAAASVPFAGTDGTIQIPELGVALFRRLAGPADAGDAAFLGPMVAMGGMAGGRGQVMTFSPGMQQAPTFDVAFLRDVVKTDPLSLTTGAVIDDVTQGNYVALVPDRSITAIAPLLRTGSPLRSALWAGLQGAADLKIESGDGWTTFRPNKIVGSRSERTDREALQILIREMSVLGAASLEAMAAYAPKSPVGAGASGLDSMVLGTLYGPSASRQMGELAFNREAYAIYARIAPGVRQQMIAQQQTGSVGQLGVFQEATKMLYFGAAGPSRIVNASPQESQRGGGRGGNWGNNPFTQAERTEVFPQGLPGGAMLRMSGSRTETIRMTQSQTGWNQTMRPEQMAWTRAATEMMGGAGGPRMMMGPDLNSFDKFMMVNEDQVTITILLTPEWEISRSLSGIQAVPGATAGRFDQLPAAVQRQYNENYARAQETFSRNQGGSGVGGFFRGGGARPPRP